MSLRLVFTTVGQQADADRLAQLAISHKLAACVQIEVVQSLYEWQGVLVNEREWRLLFKTDHDLCAPLQALLSKNHPYNTPAIYALEAVSATSPFTDWLHDALHSKASSPPP